MKHFALCRKKRSLGYMFLIVSFLFVFLLMTHAILTMENDTLNYQKETVEKNIQRACMECFVLEGRYPSSLSYLEEKYGFDYNKDLFFIDYRAIAENIMPDITVIVLDM